jgi:hypothetical protein
MGVVEHDKRAQAKGAVGVIKFDAFQHVEWPIGGPRRFGEVALSRGRNERGPDAVHGALHLHGSLANTVDVQPANLGRGGFHPCSRDEPNPTRTVLTSHLDVTQPPEHRAGLNESQHQAGPNRDRVWELPEIAVLRFEREAHTSHQRLAVLVDCAALRERKKELFIARAVLVPSQ